MGTAAVAVAVAVVTNVVPDAIHGDLARGRLSCLCLPFLPLWHIQRQAMRISADEPTCVFVVFELSVGLSVKTCVGTSVDLLSLHNTRQLHETHNNTRKRYTSLHTPCKRTT